MGQSTADQSGVNIMGEDEPAPEPVNPIKIFMSGNSGCKMIINEQHAILTVLKCLGIPIEEVDISAPGMDDQRDSMRASANKKEGQRHPLPPQLFNGEKYCGDYDDFDVANEDDELEEFLGIPRKTPKVVPGKPDEEKKEEGDAEKAPAEGAPADGESAPAEAAPADAPPAEETPAPEEAPAGEEAPATEAAPAE